MKRFGGKMRISIFILTELVFALKCLIFILRIVLFSINSIHVASFINFLEYFEAFIEEKKQKW